MNRHAPLLLVFLFAAQAMLAARTNPVAYIEHDAFIIHSFNILKDIHAFRLRTKGKFREEKHEVFNPYVRGDKDSLHIFTLKNCQVTFYNGKEKDFLLGAYFDSNDFSLGYGIRIGMAKTAFHQIFPAAASLKSEVYRVGDWSHTAWFSFHFVNDRLDHIKFQGYID